MPRDERREPIPGYEAQIHRSVWERMQTAGVPRLWAAVWLVCCLASALFFLIRFGMGWAFLPLGVWMGGHGLLMAVTAWDGQFDDLLLAQVTRWYKSYYEAD
jgi:type IV secretory pathway TrbD component